MDAQAGYCDFLVSATIGAIRDAAPFYGFVAVAALVALPIALAILHKKNWSNTTGPAFVLAGATTYVITAVLVGTAMILINPFVLMVLPPYLLSVVSMGAIVVAPVLWWKYRSLRHQIQAMQTSSVMAHGLLVLLLAGGALGLVHFSKNVLSVGNTQYHDTKSYASAQECFADGGANFMRVEGRVQVFEFPDGRVERYDTSI